MFRIAVTVFDLVFMVGFYLVLSAFVAVGIYEKLYIPAGILGFCTLAHFLLYHRNRRRERASGAAYLPTVGATTSVGTSAPQVHGSDDDLLDLHDPGAFHAVSNSTAPTEQALSIDMVMVGTETYRDTS